MTQNPLRFNQSARDAVFSLRAYAERERTPEETKTLNSTATGSVGYDTGFQAAIDIFDLITGDDPAAQRAALEAESDV